MRFRIPAADRPIVHDSEVDDPNVDLFGRVDDNGERRLTCTIEQKDKYYVVRLFYECRKGSPPPRGHFVTFITYPDFGKKNEDAYELFASIATRKSGTSVAEQTFYPAELFTVAAIGDAGDTVLTLDLENAPGSP